VGVAARAATSSAELTGNIVQTLSAESSNEASRRGAYRDEAESTVDGASLDPLELGAAIGNASSPSLSR
jgi:hypothetical protein